MGWNGEFGVGRIRITRHGMLKKKGEIAILKILRIIRRLFRKEVKRFLFFFNYVVSISLSLLQIT